MVFILPFLFMFSALLKIKSSSSLPDSTFCCGILLTITRNVITTLFCVQMFQNNYQKAWMEGKSHLLSSWSGLYEMLSINYCFNLQGSQSQMPTSSTMKRADRAWETRSPPSSIFPFPLLTEKWFQGEKKFKNNVCSTLWEQQHSHELHISVSGVASGWTGLANLSNPIPVRLSTLDHHRPVENSSQFLNET